MSVKPEESVDWKRLQSLVLQRLHAKFDRLSAKDKETPFWHTQDPETMESIVLSPNDIIIEVAGLSELGKKYITAQINLLRLLQP